jgi:glycopeptide antibiotics resistance protein
MMIETSLLQASLIARQKKFNLLLDFSTKLCYIYIMITILITEFHSFISVKIFEGGEFPRVRTTGLLSGLNRILKSELAHFKSIGVEVSVSRKGVGKFGGVKWKDLQVVAQTVWRENA